MVIEVTQDDIAKGTCSCAGCPIALAAARAYGLKYGRISVESHRGMTIYREEHGQAGITFPLPSEARKFVFNFDRDRPVPTISFEMPNLPEQEAN